MHFLYDLLLISDEFNALAYDVEMISNVFSCILLGCVLISYHYNALSNEFEGDSYDCLLI